MSNENELNEDKISCCVCGKRYKLLTNTHLQLHGLTPLEYIAKFSGAPLYAESTKTNLIGRKSKPRLDRSICARPGCGVEVPMAHNKYCSRRCSFSHRLSRDGRNEQQGNRNFANRVYDRPSLIKRTCISCSAEFVIESYSYKVTCSPECSHTHRAKLMSVRMRKFMSEQEFRQPFHKHITYGEHKFRSLWERDFAIYLDLLHISWSYEPTRIKLSNGDTYLPDFYVVSPFGPCYIELHQMTHVRPSDVCRVETILKAQKEMISLTGIPLLVFSNVTVARITYRVRKAFGIGNEFVISKEMKTERLDKAREWFQNRRWNRGNKEAALWPQTSHSSTSPSSSSLI